MDRTQTFYMALGYFVVLLIVGVLIQFDVLPFVPRSRSFGPVPVWVPWFGAVGAVLISLTGVFEHEHDWDLNYWPWHVARPFIGAILGVVSMLIFKAGVLAVGATPSQTPGLVTPTNLLYYVIAFAVGYREETFRELLKRLTDIIIAPGGGSVPVPTINAVNPATAPSNVPTSVVITGSGFTNTQSVRFGASVAQFTVNSDVQLTATTPNMPGPAIVPLTVTTKGGSATFQSFTFT